MELPLQTQVVCKEGVCGRTVSVLLNPVDDKVTHIIVQEEGAPHQQYMVPIDLATKSIGGVIQLSLSRADFKKLELFKKTKFIEEKMPDVYATRDMTGAWGTMYYWPYVTSEHMAEVPVTEYNVPKGESVIERGTPVKATDGIVGKVDELVINDQSGKITHLVMREGHLWGRRDVVIPADAILETNGDKVLVNMSKKQIEDLPAYPVKRRWA